MNNVITIGILSLNESLNLSKNLKYYNDFPVVVVDSFSSDSTVQVCSFYKNVTLLKNKFVGYATQRNFLLRHVSTPYVLFLDADEWIDTTELHLINDFLSTHNISAGLFRRRELLEGLWLKRSMQYPIYFPRLFLVQSVLIKREINEEYIYTGSSVKFEFHINHDFMSKGYVGWSAKQNEYARKESLIDYNDYAGRGFRSFVKHYSYKFYLNPLVMLIYLLFFKMAFLEGRLGVFMMFNRIIYECQVVLYRIAKNTKVKL